MTRNHFYTVTTYPEIDSQNFIGGEITKKSPPRHTPRRQKRRVVKEKYGIKSETRYFESKKAAKEHIKLNRLSSKQRVNILDWWN